MILFLLWGILFALGAGEKGDSLDLKEKLHFLWVATLIETRAAPLAHQEVVTSLRERETLGDHLAFLFLERLDTTRKEKEEILSLLENLFPESPVLFHAALVCAQKEKSFAFTSLALRFAKTKEEKLAAFEELFALLKEQGFFQEGALILAWMYREFEDQSTQKTRTLLMPLLPSLSPESFSLPSRLAFAEFLLSLGFLEEAEKFAATLEDAFLLKARLFARKGDLTALEKL
ncbi:MAG: hypothetical protein H5U36_06825, partial [Candidatus Caldatribacterium sp.]|nr:hypothetical protein [Candidatus Caldatribacterium sp.]